MQTQALAWVVSRALLAGGSLWLGGCSAAAPPVPWVSAREQCRAVVSANVDFGPVRTIGDGTLASCTEAALRQAIAPGGSFKFACGGDANGIELTRELVIEKDTLIDGENLMTLSGGFRTRLLRFLGGGGSKPATLVLRNLAIADGVADGPDGSRPAGSSGGAIYQEGGRLFIEHCLLLSSRSAPQARDVSGGALYVKGGEVFISDSSLLGNFASNGGAIGVQDGSLRVVRTSMVSNLVRGVGGWPGDGGVGGAIDMRGPGSLTLCAATLWDNYAQSFGGGLFRQGSGDDVTAIFESSIQGNYIIPEHTVQSLGGGIYLQGTQATIEASTVFGNGAAAGGGLYVGPGTNALLLNDTFSQNNAEGGGGGGILFEENVAPLPRGEVRNCSLILNVVTSLTGSGAAIAGGANGIRLHNNLFVGNTILAGYNANSCNRVLFSSGPNMQSSATWEDGSSDVQHAPCAVGVVEADTKLSSLDYYGGPTKTHYLSAANLASGLGKDCPSVDQRGQRRPSQGCTLGAYEAEH